MPRRADWRRRLPDRYLIDPARLNGAMCLRPALRLRGVECRRQRRTANPASVFCAKSGGKSEIRKGPRGQYGVCRLPDGRVVDEWAYFRAMRGRAR